MFLVQEGKIFADSILGHNFKESWRVREGTAIAAIHSFLEAAASNSRYHACST